LSQAEPLFDIRIADKNLCITAAYILRWAMARRLNALRLPSEAEALNLARRFVASPGGAAALARFKAEYPGLRFFACSEGDIPARLFPWFVTEGAASGREYRAARSVRGQRALPRTEETTMKIVIVTEDYTAVSGHAGGALPATRFDLTTTLCKLRGLFSRH